jgi:prevent-host-death family protein
MPMTIDSNEARNRWREMLDAGARKLDVIITRYGKPVSVLIDFEDYEAIKAELDDLRAARQASAAVEAWKADPSTAMLWEDFKAELIEKGLLDAEPAQ